MGEYSKPPAPVPSPETQHYWDRACSGELHVRHCSSCAKSHFYPRTMCPFCGSVETQWMETGGTGIIYAFSIMRRSKSPYVVAYVELVEGPRLITNIIDTNFDSIQIGQSVEVCFVEAEEGYKLPVFKVVHE